MRIIGDLPEMAVEIGEVSGIAAPERLLRRFGHRGAGAAGARDSRIDLAFRSAIPGQGDTAECPRHAFEGDIGVLGQFLRWKNRDDAGTGLEKAAAAQDFSTVRNRVLAAVALSGHLPGVEAKYLLPILGPWWRKTVLAPIASGATPIDPKDHYALIEMLHVVRDNLDIDLRETAANHFTTLPVYHLMSHYPAPFPAAENEYRIPLMKIHG